MMLEEKFKFGIIEKNLGFTKDKDVQGRVNTHTSYGMMVRILRPRTPAKHRQRHYFINGISTFS